MSDAIPISGFAIAPFEAARAAFACNFADNLELGANFAAVIDGETVVNLYGGYTDRAQQTLWSEGTIAGIFSSGKAVLALLAAREVSRGRLRYDAPVADYWPQFAFAGKEAITIADVMSHQAGLVGLSEEMPPQDWLDWEKICRRIENQAPLFPPGSANGYSPQLYGYILGETLRRVTGRRVGDLLGDFRKRDGLALYCGLTRDEMQRAAYMKKPPAAPDLGPLNRFKEIAFLRPWSAPARVSPEDWMAAEIPASNMHADAASLARAVYPLANGGAAADGERVIEPAILEEAFRERISGDDLVLPFHLSWCAGLMRNINLHFGPNPATFGHAGFGGSCVIVDPANRLSAAYVMNRMSPHLVGDPRALRLLDAVYEAL